ncbi:hypothetical protein EON68_00830, partial [archaeon]
MCARACTICRAFREAEERDRARRREREAAAARDAEARAQQAAEAAAAEEAALLDEAITLSKQLDEQSQVEAARSRLESHPEPVPGDGVESCVIRVVMPGGVRLQRRFASADSVSVLRDYIMVASHELAGGGG